MAKKRSVKACVKGRLPDLEGQTLIECEEANVDRTELYGFSGGEVGFGVDTFDWGDGVTMARLLVTTWADWMKGHGEVVFTACGSASDWVAMAHAWCRGEIDLPLLFDAGQDTFPDLDWDRVRALLAEGRGTPPTAGYVTWCDFGDPTRVHVVARHKSLGAAKRAVPRLRKAYPGVRAVGTNRNVPLYDAEYPNARYLRSRAVVA